MPILPELSHHKDEDDFARDFVVPLLRRLGFSIVVDFHGSREFGRNLIFGDVDRFGHVVFHGLQVGFTASVSKTGAQGLAEDCDEAFAKDFVHPHTGASHRISRFYAVNGGSISDAARKFFFAKVVPSHGDNARLLDGRALLDLDRTALARPEAGRETLWGILLEVRKNRDVLSQVLGPLAAIVKGEDQGVDYPTERLRIVALSAALARPGHIAALDLSAVESIHDRSVAFNKALDDAGASPLRTVVSTKIPARKALKISLSGLKADLEELEGALEQKLEQLGPIAPI